MTLAEFNAWLEGFSASFDGGAPNADQWESIKAKLATVQAIRLDGAQLPEKLGQPARPYWLDLPIGVCASA